MTATFLFFSNAQEKTSITICAQEVLGTKTCSMLYRRIHTNVQTKSTAHILWERNVSSLVCLDIFTTCSHLLSRTVQRESCWSLVTSRVECAHHPPTHSGSTCMGEGRPSGMLAYCGLLKSRPCHCSQGNVVRTLWSRLLCCHVVENLTSNYYLLPSPWALVFTYISKQPFCTSQSWIDCSSLRCIIWLCGWIYLQAWVTRIANYTWFQGMNTNPRRSAMDCTLSLHTSSDINKNKTLFFLKEQKKNHYSV